MRIRTDMKQIVMYGDDEQQMVVYHVTKSLTNQTILIDEYCEFYQFRSIDDIFAKPDGELISDDELPWCCETKSNDMTTSKFFNALSDYLSKDRHELLIDYGQYD